jgi:V8-like Glu-specific endopeptidase
VIGYPGGRDLAFSFQDNELLDHEGPPAGRPQIPGVCRVHYRAPTEGGSSGSPVFNANLWQVVALHHKGGKIGMPKLNGAGGTCAANEGIYIQSIAAFPKSTPG